MEDTATHTEAWRHRDVQTQRHRHSNTQRHRRTTETQQNHGDPTQSPWTGHLTTSHPQPHPIRPPILPPIRSDTLHPPPQSPHARPSIIKSHMNNSGHIITSTSRTGWPPCLPIYSQRRTHLSWRGPLHDRVTIVSCLRWVQLAQLQKSKAGGR